MAVKHGTYSKVALSHRECDAVYYDGTEASAKAVQKLGTGIVFEVDEDNKTDFKVGDVRVPGGAVGGGFVNLSPNQWIVKVEGGYEFVKDEDFQRDWVKA